MNQNYTERLHAAGLKVTPQRIAIFEAVIGLGGHPTADEIAAAIKATHPSISVGTVYKVLDTLVQNQLLHKVKTEQDPMRYDPIVAAHHHLYCVETARIEDFVDEELNDLISKYFKKNKIKNFKIQDIQLQITGKFRNI